MSMNDGNVHVHIVYRKTRKWISHGTAFEVFKSEGDDDYGVLWTQHPIVNNRALRISNLCIIYVKTHTSTMKIESFYIFLSPLSFIWNDLLFLLFVFVW